MKKLMVIGVAALVTMAMAQDKTISYADASVQIAEAAESADTMASVMKQLSAADQVKFLSKVNAAIAKQPGSPTENAAKFLAVNSAALKSAKKDNLTALLAETFATVPPEALTVINERFAADLFNRSADPSKPLSDAQFEKVATDTMKAIQARDASADNAGVRDTFAALMFLRASNGTPADLADKLVANMTDANAITKVAASSNSSRGATIYVTSSPCIECAKLIIQSGIRRVVYSEDYRLADGIELLRRAGIIVDYIDLND